MNNTIETLENCIKIDFFLRVLGWPISKVAYEIEVNERRLKEWLDEQWGKGEIPKVMKSAGIQFDIINANLRERYPIIKYKEQ